jgi:predicted Ser/Thr protein kinase
MDQASWQKAKDVLYEAQRLPGPEREAYVRLHFKHQPDVCDEVLAILPTAETLDDFSKPLVHLGSQDDELADLQPSTPIKHYTIIARLRRGGMGQVFLALDEKLWRRVALKCLLSRSSLEADRDRILAEARAAAAITHPNVATVHEVVEHDDRAFMVMEFVDGQSLDTLLARGGLTKDRVVDIGLQLVGALGAAHGSDIVHGDLKPANIMLTADGSAKVLDFGVARTVRAGSGATNALGPRGTAGPLTVVAGTPGYMSPEQLRGERIDPRSDLYSLGVVLFEMATGRRPYIAQTIGELREAVKEPAPRADAVARGIPSWLADLIAKSLEQTLTARFQSAAEMKEALEAVRRHIRELNRRELILRWLARIAAGTPLILLGLVSAGLVATVGFNWTFGRTGPNARFGGETLLGYLGGGVQAVIPTLIVATLMAVVFAAARFALNALQLIRPLGRVAQRMRARVVDFGVRMGLYRPTALAQALAGLALATLLVFSRMNWDVISAWTEHFDTAPAATFVPIGEGAHARIEYEQALNVAISAFLYGLYRAIRLRRREGTRDGTAALAVLVGVIVIMVLMCVAPFRTFHRRDLERVDVAGARCYVGGESGNELLVLCPGLEPPRTRVVRRDDPAVRRLGIAGNVFNGLIPAE